MGKKNNTVTFITRNAEVELPRDIDLSVGYSFSKEARDLIFAKNWNGLRDLLDESRSICSIVALYEACDMADVDLNSVCRVLQILEDRMDQENEIALLEKKVEKVVSNRGIIPNKKIVKVA